MAYLRTEHFKNGDSFTPIVYYVCDITGNEICEKDGWYGSDKIHICDEGVKIIVEQYLTRYEGMNDFILQEWLNKYTKRKLPYRYITKKEKKELLLKYKHECVICGSTKRLEVDHIIPVSKGGSNDVSNLQILCKTCNLKKSNK